MIRLLQSTWMVSLTGCIVYLATTAAVLSSAKFEGVSTGEETGKFSSDDDPSWKFRNPEFQQWVEELRRERAQAVTRKVQLNELETRLQAERQELSTVTQRVALLQAEFEKNVVRLREQEVKNLKRQAKTVSEMAPETAVAMLDQMADDDVVRLFSVMKTDQVTLLLETLSKKGPAPTRRAAVIIERMRHLLPTSETSPNSAPAAF